PGPQVVTLNGVVVERLSAAVVVAAGYVVEDFLVAGARADAVEHWIEIAYRRQPISDRLLVHQGQEARPPRRCDTGAAPAAAAFLVPGAGVAKLVVGIGLRRIMRLLPTR